MKLQRLDRPRIDATCDTGRDEVDRPVVLVLTDYFDPGFKAGGAPRSVANLIDHLGDEYSFRVVTRDRDMGDRHPYAQLPSQRWTHIGNAQVLYLPPSAMGVRVLRRILKDTKHDVLYLNSFFSPRFTITPLILRRLGIVPSRSIVLAPHGELKPAALQLKRAKKALYLRVARIFGLHARVLWHASSVGEAEHFRHALGPKINIAVAIDLPTRMAGDDRAPMRMLKTIGALSIAFVSRVSREKNLDVALDLLRTLKGQVDFHVYGPRMDAVYWKECEVLIRSLPAHVQVHDHGAVPPHVIAKVLQRHHVMLLPTQGENYGHVVLEALLAGCPPLISDQTPWRGLEQIGVGWDIALDRPEQFRAVLQQCIDMAASPLAAISERARRYGAGVASAPEALAQNRALLERSVQCRTRPD